MLCGLIGPRRSCHQGRRRLCGHLCRVRRVVVLLQQLTAALASEGRASAPPPRSPKRWGSLGPLGAWYAGGSGTARDSSGGGNGPAPGSSAASSGSASSGSVKIRSRWPVRRPRRRVRPPVTPPRPRRRQRPLESTRAAAPRPRPPKTERPGPRPWVRTPGRATRSPSRSRGRRAAPRRTPGRATQRVRTPRTRGTATPAGRPGTGTTPPHLRHRQAQPPPGAARRRQCPPRAPTGGRQRRGRRRRAATAPRLPLPHGPGRTGRRPSPDGPSGRSPGRRQPRHPDASAVSPAATS